MKALFPLVLLALLALTACEDDTTSDRAQQAAREVETTDSYVAGTDQDTASYRPLYLHNIPPADQLNSPNTAYGGYGQVLPPPMDKFHTQVLNNGGIWTFEFYYDEASSIPQRRAGAGQWMQFRPDGTFIGGHWDRQTYAGAYYLDFQGKYPRLTLDANVDRMDAKWDLQGITGDQEEMAWRRVSDGGFGPHRESVMGKLIKLTSLPTKEQFAGPQG